MYNEAEIALIELEEATTDIKKSKSKSYEKRPITNLFDRVDVNTMINFEEANNAIRTSFNVNTEDYTIIQWHIAYNQLKKQ